MNFIKSRSREMILLAIIFGIIIVASIVNPRFLAVNNFANIFSIIAPMGLMTLGMTLIITTGNIDVSIGSIFYVCCYSCAMMCRAWNGEYVGLIILISVGIGMGLGFLNGTLVAFLKLPSIVVTLVMMGVLRGIILVKSGGVMIGDLYGPYTKLATISFGPLYITPMIWIILNFVLFFVIHKLRFGRMILALGSNPYAAERIGIHKGKMCIAVFAISGLLVGLAAAFYTAKIGIVQGVLGAGMEMKVIAAVVIGGTAFSGGRLSLLGSFCGVLLMGLMDNMLALMKVPIYWQSMTVGVLLLIAVVSSTFTADAAKSKIKYDDKKLAKIIEGQ